MIDDIDKTEPAASDGAHVPLSTPRLDGAIELESAPDYLPLTEDDADHAVAVAVGEVDISPVNTEEDSGISADDGGVARMNRTNARTLAAEKRRAEVEARKLERENVSRRLRVTALWVAR